MCITWLLFASNKFAISAALADVCALLSAILVFWCRYRCTLAMITRFHGFRYSHHALISFDFWIMALPVVNGIYAAQRLHASKCTHNNARLYLIHWILYAAINSYRPKDSCLVRLAMPNILVWEFLLLATSLPRSLISTVPFSRHYAFASSYDTESNWLWRTS